MNGDPRYTGVALMLPQVLPPITMRDAVRAYSRLVRAFGGTEHIPVGVLEARGGRPIRSNYRSIGRRCWASTTPTSSHLKGWGRLIHDASHYVFECRHPSARPHDGGHAQLECQMAHYVAQHGLLERIATKPKPSKRKSYAERIEHTRELMNRWERRAKRASTAIRKLRRRMRALERASQRVTS